MSKFTGHKDYKQQHREDDFDVRVGFENITDQSNPSSRKSRSNQKGKQKQSQNRKNYQSQRQEDLRRKRGGNTRAAVQDTVKKNLAASLPSQDVILNRLEVNQSWAAITLPITTRGIGIGCAYTYFTLAHNKDVVLPSIYSLFRVGLALVESKLELSKREYQLPMRNVARNYETENNLALSQVCRSVTIMPEPLKRVVNAIGVFQHDGVTYLPAVMKNSYTADDQLIPRPENLLLSNLRKTVLALADCRTPESFRRYFVENNSIPGAQYNEQYFLLNPDEIMPADYEYDTSLRDDVMQISLLLGQIQKHLPKLVNGTVNYLGQGHISQLVSNNMENLAIPSRTQGLTDYYKVLIPTGNVRSYWSKVKMAKAESLEGQVNLLGENPKISNFINPFYSLRDEAINPILISSDFKGINQILYMP